MSFLFAIDLFEQTGQYEPLTTRIRNILREYKDGVGIFKELIQNADDAGATTVKFLVDWRKGRTGSLFSPGMAECQGPSLWAYNNAVFTDKDFENINKLAGETKVEDISKIGRFGLGFNAVYHLTDVPSFISREYLIVFDPNIHHLQRRIKDRSRPGIRINLAKKPESLTSYHDQFQLYNCVFGCNTMQTQGGFYYDGTLFRFPFRTATQASTSDIIKTAYGRNRIQSIVSSLCECARTLLIFSQHVKEVEVYELDESCQPDEMRLVLSVNKPTVKAFRRKGVNKEEPFIKQCSKWWANYRDSQKSCTEYPSGCELVNIVTTKESSELSGCDRRHSSDLKWFVVSASGTDASLAIARSPEGRDRGFLPCGGAAFVVQKVSEQGSWESTVTSDLSGELFCFLPLSIRTGLPVHVNGYFAIMPNRVEIWKRTIMRTQSIEVEWNEVLMEDALARAYIMLLKNMKALIDKVQDYKFHTLWPSNDAVDMKSWEKLVRKVCSVLLDQQSKLFCSDGIWMSINDGFLLGDDFDEIYETAVEVLRSLRIHVFNLPANILQTLMKFDKQRILQQRTLTFSVFIEQYFFPNVKILAPAQRDAIVCFGLDRILKENKSSLLLFRENACISVSQDGKTLKKPSELIHPFGPAAELFADEDHRFPVGDGLRVANRLYVLEKLGMVKDLDWPGILERAMFIADRGCPTETERSRKLIKYLNKRIDQLPKSDNNRSFQRVKFLPVLRRPAGEYVLPWKGSLESPLPRAPNEIFLPKDAKLIGSSCFIINISDESGCGKLNAKVKDLLGFSNRRPADKLVIQQLDEANKYWCNLSEEEKQETWRRLAIEAVCRKIYGFFNHGIIKKPRNQSFLTELGKRNWLFLQGKFVQSKKVAYTSNGKGAPFLFTLPPEYKRDYRNLFEAVQLKQKFDDEDYISALCELESSKQGNVLKEDELHIAVFFINEINAQNPDIEEYIGNIPLPDTDSILRRSQEVVVNLSLWLEDTDVNLKVHEKIPPQTAHALGAKPLKNVILKKFSRRIDYGKSFGQHEDLTDRLKGILDGYPIDGILKELVQNADDAKASEIHFIHDTRSLASEKVAIEDKTCEEIQGPALCVYNDRPFTEKDLEGIKKLGIGGKRDIIVTTGRYGIGFNSVYHLTDCPSFLSNDDTLVILDPHRRYVLDKDTGKLFKLTTNLRNKISDTLNGYLAEHFNLQGSTMFRFPLRRKRNESEISKLYPDMEKLLMTFKDEARKSLLFLDHIKKITLSKIDPTNNKLEEIYRVETTISPEDEKKREELARKICKLSTLPTEEIGCERVSYTLTIKENKKEIEKWLIQKCIGAIITTKKRGEIPDGRKLGFLPRGGLAARLWAHSSSSETNPVLRGRVYCFLPLPENYTNLPVHVNGHFALDNQRRRLWTNTDGKGGKSKWNHFMNTCVLPPAYAALIMEARDYLCNDEADNQLSRYHALFPRVFSDSPWRTLTTELYRYLGQIKAKVLPLLVPTESKDEATTSFLQPFPGSSFFSSVGGLVTSYMKKTNIPEPSQPVHITRTRWLSVDQAYFIPISGLEDNFLHLLVRTGLPVLLHAPHRIHRSFRSAGVTLHEVSPKNIIDFLREFESKKSACTIENLPKKLETTTVKTVAELSALIEYCCKDEDFGEHLEGLPLLLTQDSYLKVFDPCQPVFHSEFGDLFPTQSHLFVHSQIVHRIPRNVTKSKENIVVEFTVEDLAGLLPHMFTDTVLRAIEDDVTWKFPAEGILFEQWFEKFWDFLQNHAKPKSDEEFLSLTCLSKWPVIPTICGKLVTIENAKFVLDMTATGTESAAQENVRTFLSNLKCPVLNKDITFEDKHSSATNHISEDQTTTRMSSRRVVERRTAVTDPYVGHPHNVVDVLSVLSHMLQISKLNLSGIHEHEEQIRNFLQFVQDNYEWTGLLGQCKQMVKGLPFHKALNGQFVSLMDQRCSYAFIPSGVPTYQLDDLQMQAKCCFLNPDALPALDKLYRDLGVRASENVAQFYVEYIFKHFSMFTRESQIQHLIYIRDEVYPFRPDTKMLRRTMNENPCIPGKDGDLHFAQDFFDPTNEVFKVMFENDYDMFPPSPFGNTDWLQLLKDIGLQVDITPQLFLQFCTTVAEDEKRSSVNQRNRERSEVLVKCLFSEKVLQEETFLSQVSQIMFIAPAKAEEKLTTIHKQHQCQENGFAPFIKFENAVPWCYRFITWTTAPLLPIWGQPNNMVELKNLRIACSGPTYTNVLGHLKNVVTCSPDSVDSEYLHKMITNPICQFLFNATKCCGRSPNDECSDVCVDIGTRLKSFPCIFLQEEGTFVKAEQLVFSLSKDCPLQPFLYSVPREFGELEHFLKRLGATENGTPLQFAYVLNSIHDEVGEKVLSPELEEKVKYAMRVLFGLLRRGESPDGIRELYLPDQGKQLVISCQMVCKVPSRFTEVIEKLQRPILLSFQECGLKNVVDDYIDALPDHLRPVKFDDIVREEIDPEFQDSVCPEAEQGSICTFQQQFQKLLRCDEFQEGLKRLLVEDHQNPKEFEQTIKKLQTNVKTKCTGFDRIKINIIDRNTNEVLDHLTDSCYAVQGEGTWFLFMQHDLKDDRRLVSTVTCVNKILGDCIQKEKGMIAMLGCASPSEIARELNWLNITESTSKAVADLDDEPFPGWDDVVGGTDCGPIR